MVTRPVLATRRRPRGRVAALALVVVVLGLAVPAPPPAQAVAPAPAKEGCLATSPVVVDDCPVTSVTYASISSITDHVVHIGDEVTLSTDPEDTTTPIQCDDLGCTYHGVKWEFDTFFDRGFQVV